MSFKGQHSINAFRNYQELVPFLNKLQETPNDCLTKDDLSKISNGFVIIFWALRKKVDDAGKVGSMLCEYYSTLRERIALFPDKLNLYNKLLPICFLSLLKWLEHIIYIEENNPGTYNVIIQLLWSLLLADINMVPLILKSRQRDTLVKLWTATALAGDFKIQQKTYELMQLMFKFADFTGDIDRFIGMEKFDFVARNDFFDNQSVFLKKFNAGLFPYSNVFRLSALHLTVGNKYHYFPPCDDEYIWLSFNFLAHKVTTTIASKNSRGKIDISFTIKHMVYEYESCLIVFEILPPIEYKCLALGNIDRESLQTSLIQAQLTKDNYEFLKENVECIRKIVWKDVRNKCTQTQIKRPSIKRGLFKIVPSSTQSHDYSISNVLDTTENIVKTPGYVENSENNLSASGLMEITDKISNSNECQETEPPFVQLHSTDALFNESVEDDQPLALLRSEHSSTNMNLADVQPITLRRSKRKRVQKITYANGSISKSHKRKKWSRKSSGIQKQKQCSTVENMGIIDLPSTSSAVPVVYDTVPEQEKATSMATDVYSFEAFCDDDHINKKSTPKLKNLKEKSKDAIEVNYWTKNTYPDVEIPREAAPESNECLSLLEISFNSSTHLETTTLLDNRSVEGDQMIPNEIHINVAQEEASTSKSIPKISSKNDFLECKCTHCSQYCTRIQKLERRLQQISKDVSNMKMNKKTLMKILHLYFSEQKLGRRRVDGLIDGRIEEMLARYELDIE